MQAIIPGYLKLIDQGADIVDFGGTGATKTGRIDFGYTIEPEECFCHFFYTNGYSYGFQWVLDSTGINLYAGYVYTDDVAYSWKLFKAKGLAGPIEHGQETGLSLVSGTGNFTFPINQVSNANLAVHWPCVIDPPYYHNNWGQAWPIISDQNTARVDYYTSGAVSGQIWSYAILPLKEA